MGQVCKRSQVNRHAVVATSTAFFDFIIKNEFLFHPDMTESGPVSLCIIWPFLKNKNNRVSLF